MSDKEIKSVPFYPDHISSEAKVVAGIVFVALVFGVLGLLSPVGIGDPADPLNTPAHVKPEWYFLALYQLLKYIPKVAGVVLPVLGVVLVITWPFLRRRVDTSRRAVTVRAIAVGVALVVFIVMTIWGEVS